MAIMEAGRTEHIVVNYDDSRGPDAGSRAQMLLGSCEADLMRLERDYFRIAGIFEPPSPPLLVVVSSGSFRFQQRLRPPPAEHDHHRDLPGRA